jgi:three-Cys-motif partner protein
LKKSHREGTVGPWAKLKLGALQSYLEAYMLVMKNQPFHLTYVDAFAGVGVSKVRRTEPQDDGFHALLDDEDRIAADEFVQGSPLRALGLSRPFDQYYFIDRDPQRVKMLQDLHGQFPACRINPIEDDANAAVQRIAQTFGPWNRRGVAFLDPYGAHLHWQTLQTLADTRKFDVIINFPLDMAINRLLKVDTVLAESTVSQFDLCFGDRSWYDASYVREGGLFGDQLFKRRDARDRLLRLYVEKLKQAFGHVAGPSLIRNTRGGSLYHLVWASSNGRGQSIAKHILNWPEK